MCCMKERCLCRCNAYVYASAMYLCVRNMNILPASGLEIQKRHFSISKRPFHSVNLNYAWQKRWPASQQASQRWPRQAATWLRQQRQRLALAESTVKHLVICLLCKCDSSRHARIAYLTWADTVCHPSWAQGLSPAAAMEKRCVWLRYPDDVSLHDRSTATALILP